MKGKPMLKDTSKIELKATEWGPKEVPHIDSHGFIILVVLISWTIQWLFGIGICKKKAK